MVTDLTTYLQNVLRISYDKIYLKTILRQSQVILTMRPNLQKNLTIISRQT